MLVTKSQLINRLMEHRNGANPVSIHAVVQVPMRKSPFPEIFKEEWITGMVQFNYRKAVLRQQEREGLVPRFKPGTSWHHVVLKDNEKLSPFSMHKDIGAIEYLRVRKMQVYGTNYFDVDGRDVRFEDIEPYIKVKNEPHGLKNPIQFRIYKLDSIIDIKIDNIVYTLRQQS